MSRKLFLGLSNGPFRSAAIAVAALLGLLLLAAAAPARERPTFFERDYQTAEELNEYFEQLEDANLLTALDFTDDAIVAFGCPDEHRAYSEALAEVTKLADRIRAGEFLTPDEKLYYEDQQAAEVLLWGEFEECYDRQLRDPSMSDDLPPEINSHAAVVETYDRLRKKHGWQQEEGYDAVAAEIEERIDEVESEPAYIATVTSVFRTVEYRRKGGYVPLEKGDKIMLQDVIRTGPRGRARLELHDRIEEKNAGPTVVNIGSNSEVGMEKFEVRFEEDEGFLDHAWTFVRGTIRAFTQGFAGRAAFSIRTGTSLCGIRGTEIRIDYLPELDEVTYTLYEGVVEITTPDGKVSLGPGERLTVRGGVPGPVQPIAAQS